jgi:hypothetical protein
VFLLIGEEGCRRLAPGVPSLLRGSLGNVPAQLLQSVAN